MAGLIVHSSGPIACVGGAQVSLKDLNKLSSSGHIFVAADSGADHLLAAGLRPVAVIGDLDSISDAARQAFGDVLHHVPEQDTTDFEKLLTRVSAPVIMALGFAGQRLDHTLSVLAVLARIRACHVVLLSTDDACVLLPPSLQLDLPAGTRVSLMPISTAQVTATGLRWPLRNAQLDPLGMTSPSNAAIGGLIDIRCDGAAMLVVPRDHADALTAAVRAQ